ncbi:hypothetical protein ABG067_000855 [Albugo candida]
MVMVNKRPEEPTRDSGATNATDSSEPAAKLKASQIAAIPITKAFDAGETPTTAKTGTIRKVADDVDQKADAITYQNNDTGAPKVPHLANEQPSATYVNNTGSGSTNGSEAEIPDTGFQNATNANKTDSDSRAGSQTEVEEQSTSGSEVSSESAGSEDEEEEDTSKEESTDSSTKIDETSTAMTLPLSAIFLPVEAVIAIFIVI